MKILRALPVIDKFILHSSPGPVKIFIEDLDQGRIAEDGTYDELIAKKGLFADLVARQHVSAPA